MQSLGRMYPSQQPIEVSVQWLFLREFFDLDWMDQRVLCFGMVMRFFVYCLAQNFDFDESQEQLNELYRQAVWNYFQSDNDWMWKGLLEIFSEINVIHLPIQTYKLLSFSLSYRIEQKMIMKKRTKQRGNKSQFFFLYFYSNLMKTSI